MEIPILITYFYIDKVLLEFNLFFVPLEILVCKYCRCSRLWPYFVYVCMRVPGVGGYPNIVHEFFHYNNFIKYLLNPSDHIHIWLVVTQLSCVGTWSSVSYEYECDICLVSSVLIILIRWTKIMNKESDMVAPTLGLTGVELQSILHK